MYIFLIFSSKAIIVNVNVEYWWLHRPFDILSIYFETKPGQITHCIIGADLGTLF
jgi:hypothetical protein